MSYLPINKTDPVACPRCRRPVSCQSLTIQVCGCRAVALTEAQQHYIRARYTGCLCVDCLLLLQKEHDARLAR